MSGRRRRRLVSTLRRHLPERFSNAHIGRFLDITKQRVQQILTEERKAKQMRKAKRAAAREAKRERDSALCVCGCKRAGHEGDGECSECGHCPEFYERGL